ncbi:hypothetical protein DID77_04370 [Candidatus Marinamargulisbacteria bacterium SCGC AG-439-L15]|nr:hypothetical protein DID77_04370 [Candidatus Marinamargulisbacteria bacterium SCGC AG-439-L15]
MKLSQRNGGYVPHFPKCTVSGGIDPKRLSRRGSYACPKVSAEDQSNLCHVINSTRDIRELSTNAKKVIMADFNYWGVEVLGFFPERNTTYFYTGQHDGISYVNQENNFCTSREPFSNKQHHELVSLVKELKRSTSASAQVIDKPVTFLSQTSSVHVVTSQSSCLDVPGKQGVVGTVSVGNSDLKLSYLQTFYYRAMDLLKDLHYSDLSERLAPKYFKACHSDFKCYNDTIHEVSRKSIIAHEFIHAMGGVHWGGAVWPCIQKVCDIPYPPSVMSSNIFGLGLYDGVQPLDWIVIDEILKRSSSLPITDLHLSKFPEDKESCRLNSCPDSHGDYSYLLDPTISPTAVPTTAPTLYKSIGDHEDDSLLTIIFPYVIALSIIAGITLLLGIYIYRPCNRQEENLDQERGSGLVTQNPVFRVIRRVLGNSTPNRIGSYEPDLEEGGLEAPREDDLFAIG